VRAFLRYTLARASFFAAAFLLLRLAGVDLFISILGGLIVSGIAAYFFLRNQRQALSEVVAARIQSGRLRMNQATTKEDTD
jgi:hypothetical protein